MVVIFVSDVAVFSNVWLVRFLRLFMWWRVTSDLGENLRVLASTSSLDLFP